jgi:hypothetical protein
VIFVVITLYVASQRVFIVVYFVIDSVRKLLDVLSSMETDILSELSFEIQHRHIRLKCVTTCTCTFFLWSVTSGEHL